MVNKKVLVDIWSLILKVSWLNMQLQCSGLHTTKPSHEQYKIFYQLTAEQQHSKHHTQVAIVLKQEQIDIISQLYQYFLAIPYIAMKSSLTNAYQLLRTSCIMYFHCQSAPCHALLYGSISSLSYSKTPHTSRLQGINA